MKLEIEGEVIGKNPSSEEIAKALSSLDGENKSFAILEYDKLTYIQTSGSIKGGFSLEYQNGSLKEHFYCPHDLPLDDVTRAFQSYAKGEKGWQTDFNWTTKKLAMSYGNKPVRQSKVVFPPLVICMLACVVLCFIAVFFGKKGTSQRIWITVFFAAATFFVVAGTTQGLREGRFVQRFYTVTRVESPIQFWFMVIFGYTFSSAILAIGILALVKSGH